MDKLQILQYGIGFGIVTSFFAIGLILVELNIKKEVLKEDYIRLSTLAIILWSAITLDSMINDIKEKNQYEKK